MKSMYKIIIVLVALTMLYSCQVVKPYQSQFVNDYYMEQGPLSVDKAEIEGFNYREGASGGEGGKVGGGCGCN
jgi:Domain of unknown function (DUF4266)